MPRATGATAFEALRAKYEAPAAVEEKSDAPSVEYVT